MPSRNRVACLHYRSSAFRGKDVHEEVQSVPGFELAVPYDIHKPSCTALVRYALLIILMSLSANGHVLTLEESLRFDTMGIARNPQPHALNYGRLSLTTTTNPEPRNTHSRNLKPINGHEPSSLDIKLIANLNSWHQIPITS